MSTTDQVHYSVRDQNGFRFACYQYEAMARTVADRENKAGRGEYTVKPVRDCECPHGF